MRSTLADYGSDGQQSLAAATEDLEDDQEAVDEHGRPEVCECVPALARGDMPCWECYRRGFEDPHPEVVDDAE